MFLCYSKEFWCGCFEVDVFCALCARRELSCEDQQSHRGFDVHSRGIVSESAAGCAGARGGSRTASHIGDEQEHATVEGNLTHLNKHMTTTDADPLPPGCSTDRSAEG